MQWGCLLDFMQDHLKSISVFFKDYNGIKITLRLKHIFKDKVNIILNNIHLQLKI